MRHDLGILILTKTNVFIWIKNCCCILIRNLRRIVLLLRSFCNGQNKFIRFVALHEDMISYLRGGLALSVVKDTATNFSIGAGEHNPDFCNEMGIAIIALTSGLINFALQILHLFLAHFGTNVKNLVYNGWPFLLNGHISAHMDEKHCFYWWPFSIDGHISAHLQKKHPVYSWPFLLMVTSRHTCKKTSFLLVTFHFNGHMSDKCVPSVNFHFH